VVTTIEKRLLRGKLGRHEDTRALKALIATIIGT